MPKPPEQRVQRSVCLRPPIAAHVDELADTQGRSRSRMLERLVELGLQALGPGGRDAAPSSPHSTQASSAV